MPKKKKLDKTVLRKSVPYPNSKHFKKGCPGWGANPGSFDFAYFLILSLYR
jgi:hypothetical protein